MLDYKFIAENLQAVMANIADRFMKADAEAVARLYAKRTELTTNQPSIFTAKAQCQCRSDEG